MKNPYVLRELPQLNNKPSLKEREEYAVISHENYMHHKWAQKRVILVSILEMTTENYLDLVNSKYPDGFYGLCR